MLVYAEKTDIPECPERWLYAASNLVTQHTRLAVYDTDTEGYPADPEIREAFRQAVITQCEAWKEACLDPDLPGEAGQVTSSVSQGPRSESYADAANIARLRRDLRMYLCSSAAAVLSGLPTRVRVY